MAVGDQFLQPEDGWIRYDDRDQFFTYEGGWTRIAAGDWYNGTRSYSSSAASSRIKFSFKGTGLRVIGAHDVDSTNIRVSVDGVSDGFVPLTLRPPAQQVVLYEKMGFTNTIHQCVIDYNCYWAQFDAVDIKLVKESVLYLKDNAVYGVKEVV